MLELTDVGAERQAERYEAEHVAMVEAVRIGTLIAQSRRNESRWRAHVARNRARVRGPGATGADLHRAVMAIAATDPGLVKFTTKG